MKKLFAAAAAVCALLAVGAAGAAPAGHAKHAARTVVTKHGGKGKPAGRARRRGRDEGQVNAYGATATSRRADRLGRRGRHVEVRERRRSLVRRAAQGREPDREPLDARLESEQPDGDHGDAVPPEGGSGRAGTGDPCRARPLSGDKRRLDPQRGGSRRDRLLQLGRDRRERREGLGHPRLRRPQRAEHRALLGAAEGRERRRHRGRSGRGADGEVLRHAARRRRERERDRPRSLAARVDREVVQRPAVVPPGRRRGVQGLGPDDADHGPARAPSVSTSGREGLTTERRWGRPATPATSQRSRSSTASSRPSTTPSTTPPSRRR